jgi:tetratricopeptide (TPR) repeat protein
MPVSPVAALLAAALLACAGSAQAAALKDPQWNALLEAGKTAELDKAARARVQSQPDDAQGYLAVALAAVNSGEAAPLEAALKQAEACVERLPQSAQCHYALGSVLGMQAMSASLFKGMGMAGRIRDAFARAVELDSAYFEARDSLVQFYLLAPSLAGGSVPKAKEAAAAIQARQPEHAKLLRARIALKEEKWTEAERELASVHSDDKDLRDGLVEALTQLGTQYLRDKQPGKARQLFEQLVQQHPGQALGPYGLGRVLIETGDAAGAIVQLERARSLQGAAGLPIDHRLGQAYLAKGDKAQGKAALERFVANGKANPRNLEDARKRLAELG